MSSSCSPIGHPLNSRDFDSRRTRLQTCNQLIKQQRHYLLNNQPGERSCERFQRLPPNDPTMILNNVKEEQNNMLDLSCWSPRDRISRPLQNEMKTLFRRFSSSLHPYMPNHSPFTQSNALRDNFRSVSHSVSHESLSLNINMTTAPWEEELMNNTQQNSLPLNCIADEQSNEPLHTSNLRF